MQDSYASTCILSVPVKALSGSYTSVHLHLKYSSMTGLY